MTKFTDETIKHLSGPLAREHVKERTQAGRRLSAERLRELLRYDPLTGIFTRIKRSGIGAHSLSNRPAGSTNNQGYVLIGVDGGKAHKAHRLAFLYMRGEWPSHKTDHQDMIRDNNSWENLRPCSNSENGANRPICKNNKCGLKGVHQRPYGRYAAQMTKDGKKIHLGYYDTAILAHEAYCRAAQNAHREFANFGRVG